MNKKQVIFVHGGDSYETQGDFLNHLRTVVLRDPLGERTVRWSDTLRVELGQEYEVFMPAMPNKQNARYEEWAIWFERHLELIRDEVILIGWSLGGMFLAKYLSEHTPAKQITSLFLLAAPGGAFTDVTGQGGDCSDFRPDPSRLDRLATIPHIEIWHSHDDFVVPVAEAEWYKTHVSEAKMTIFNDKNHFLVPELPELIRAIKDCS